jgi:outer membrane biogenesis lipoprotein LolB
MRSFYLPAVAATLLAACASQTSAPTAPAKAPAAPEAKTATVKAPQCYSAETGRFHNVGEKAVIAGVPVSCKATADGKAAAWAGDKH